MTTTLCAICALPSAGVCCQTCEAHIRADLHQVATMRRMLDAWTEIDPGSPCRDEPHRLALVDNPVLTQSGDPDLTVIAATDIRTKRIPNDKGGWDADDVVNVDAELLSEARLLIEERHLSVVLASVEDCLRVLEASIEWSLRCDRVDEHAAVLASCAVALRAVLRDHPERPLGVCPQPDPRGISDRCGGPLRWRAVDAVAWTSGEVDDLAAIELECGRCSDVWGTADLPNVLRVVQPQMRFPVSRDWVAKRYGVNASTLRSWVRRGQVRTSADEQVDLLDVLARIQEG